jgi:transposase
LKRAIRHRKNSLFFKNSVGAAVGDIHMSVLLTAKENGLNPVHYLAALLKFEKERKQNPEDFLPWNFTATLERLKLQLPSPLSE